MSPHRPNAPYRVCLFVGPSVRAPELHATCAGIVGEVEIRPPAQQGDVLRLLPDVPDVVGIVDGAFFDVPAPLHKEILLAIELGARVLGASSLGALRAAELDRYGMEGIGTIYRMYRRGTLVDDGDVGVIHTDAEDGFRPLTVPLVNVRYNLDRARRRGVVSRTTAAAVLAAATGIYFAERTYEAVLRTPEAVALPRDEIVALRHFLTDDAIDLKRRDALELVRTIAERTQGRRPWPARTAITTPRTWQLERYLREYVGSNVAGRHVSDAHVLGFEKLLHPRFPELRAAIARRCLAVEAARGLGLVARSPAALLDEHRRTARLPSDAALDAWLDERDLTLDELVASLRERDLERQMLTYARPRANTTAIDDAYQTATALLEARTALRASELARPLLIGPGLTWDAPLLRELKERGECPAARSRAARIFEFGEAWTARYPDRSPARLKRERVERWCAERWGIEPSELRQASFARGFAGLAELDAVARPAYLYARFGPAGVL
jgi:hypothetical protein